MGILELFLIAAGLSMDAFAVAVCHGLSMKTASYKKAFVVGLYFGVFQAAMPVIGYIVASRFSDAIVSFDHWVAFALLAFIGGRMIAGSFKKEEDGKEPGVKHAQTGEGSLKPAVMLPLAFATSIDALAVGVSFAFLRVLIAPAALFIGITTFVLSVAGVKIGGLFGMKLKSKAELFGGIILVLMGLKILFEHLSGAA